MGSRGSSCEGVSRTQAERQRRLHLRDVTHDRNRAHVSHRQCSARKAPPTLCCSFTPPANSGPPLVFSRMHAQEAPHARMPAECAKRVCENLAAAFRRCDGTCVLRVRPGYTVDVDAWILPVLSLMQGSGRNLARKDSFQHRSCAFTWSEHWHHTSATRAAKTADPPAGPCSRRPHASRCPVATPRAWSHGWPCTQAADELLTHSAAVRHRKE